MSVHQFAQCTKSCAADESKCLASNMAINGAPAVCGSQQALCLGSCADNSKTGMSKAAIAWIVVFAIIAVVVVVYATLYAQRHGYIRKIKNRVQRRARR